MVHENNHHLNWCAREWKRNTIHRRIREHPGMIIKLPINLHNQLHHEIPPVRPPALQVARYILDNLISVDNDCNPYTNLRTQYYKLTEYYKEDLPYSEQAYDLAEHYIDQYDFIRENR